MATTQQARIVARVSREQKRLFERAAAIEGITLTGFAISSMQREAARVVQSHAAIELSERNRRAFIDALMNLPEPNKVRRQAARAYLKNR